MYSNTIIKDKLEYYGSRHQSFRINCARKSFQCILYKANILLINTCFVPSTACHVILQVRHNTPTKYHHHHPPFTSSGQIIIIFIIQTRFIKVLSQSSLRLLSVGLQVIFKHHRQATSPPVPKPSGVTSQNNNKSELTVFQQRRRRRRRRSSRAFIATQLSHKHMLEALSVSPPAGHT